MAQAWTSNNVYQWDTSGALPGQYDFEVWVRDATSNASYDTYTDLYYTLQ